MFKGGAVEGRRDQETKRPLSHVPFLCLTGSSVASSSWAIWPRSEAMMAAGSC